MPDKDGRITPEEHVRCNAQFEGYEKQMGRDLPCEVCGGIVWRLNGQLVMVLGDSAKGAFGSGVKTPLVNYFCTNCGNMKFFAAFKWDMMIKPDEAGSGAPPKAQGEASDGN